MSSELSGNKRFLKVASLEKMNDLEYFFNTVDERFEKVLKCQMADIFFFSVQLMKDLKQFLDIRWL